jgi:hypothetical protein
MESDCANVITVLEAKQETHSTLWCVTAETLAVLELRKINRSSNKEAHSLAQLGKGECGVLDEAGPPCVATLLIDDCINIVPP